jgi:hypothetical protein
METNHKMTVLSRFDKTSLSEINSQVSENSDFIRCAWVAELVDARDLKSLGLRAVPVRFRP